MTAYVIGNITVKDPDKWAEYRSLVPATLVPWGAELVLRGKQALVPLRTQAADVDLVTFEAD
jgi:uncharacterized protein (DUF1330 family)